MAEENVLPSAEQEPETPAEPEEAEASEGEEDETVDYAARVKELEAQVEKLESDRKAALGSRNSQRERDEVLFGLKDELDAMKRSNSALLKALSSGETEGLADELTSIEKESAESRASRQFEEKYASLMDDLKEAVSDDQGNFLIDFQSEEMKPWVKAWNEAYNRKDLTEMATKLSEAAVKARRAERDRAKKAAETKKPSKKEKQDKGNLDLGPASGAAKDEPDLSPTDRIARGLKKRGGLE